MKTKKSPTFINPKQKYVALLLAFSALTINFWAWSLISPLASQFADELSLEPIELSILLAVPVLVGALGRIPLGVLTDKYGGKKIFSVVCFIAVLPVLGLAFSSSYNQFIVTAFALGLSGATFAIGIPFVNSWFESSKRGLALGIYSMGNAGTAVSGFLTPNLSTEFGRQNAYLIVAVLLIVIGLVFMRYGKNSPLWKPSKGSFMQKLTSTAKSPLTVNLSIMYAVSFGAFVAFGVYLPVLLKVVYGLTLTDAAARAGGFILLATICRPLGGWLSDKFGGQNIVRFGFIAISILAAIVAFQTNLNHFTSATYLGLAAVIGVCNGAIIALVGKLSKPDQVGSVTGIVGAFGGLGGFLPPIVLGVTYQKTNSYALALVLLSIVSALTFITVQKNISILKTAP